MAFIVVKFLQENNSLAAVPVSWFKENKCYWPPPGSNVSTLARNQATPVENVWDFHPAAIVGNIIFGNPLF